MHIQRSEAVVLRRYDFSETSQVIAVWTRQAGRIRLLAKGIKRRNRSFEGVPDLLCVGTAVWLERANREGLSLLTEWRQVRDFPGLRTCLLAQYAALYIAELLTHLTEDFDPHPQMFESVLTTLAALDEIGRRSAVVQGKPSGLTQDTPEVSTVELVGRFTMSLLCDIGSQPVLEECVHCGRGLPGLAGALDTTNQEWYFSSRSGGLVCRDCEPSVHQKRYVSPAAAALMRHWQTPELPTQGQWPAIGSAVPVWPVMQEAAELLRRHVFDVAGREFETARFLWALWDTASPTTATL